MIDLDVHPCLVEHLEKELQEGLRKHQCSCGSNLVSVITVNVWREGDFLCLFAKTICSVCQREQNFGLNPMISQEMEQEIIHKGESK